MINTFFVFYNEIPWIGQSSNVWGLFLAISVHVTMEKHKMKGLMIICLFYIIMSYIADSNLVPQEMKKIEESLLFGLVFYIIFLVGILTGNKNKNSKNKSKTKACPEKYEEKDDCDIATELQIELLENQCKELDAEIAKLRYKLSQIRTSSRVFGIGFGEGMSKSEQTHNMRLRDKIYCEIQDLETQRYIKKNNIDMLRSFLRK